LPQEQFQRWNINRRHLSKGQRAILIEKASESANALAKESGLSPEPLFRTCMHSVTSRNSGMPPENNYYNEVILNDPTLTVDNPVSGHEIQVIVGSPSKVAKGTLIEFAKELTEHIRGNQRWSGVHVTVEPIELQDLPPLGEPSLFTSFCTGTG
jgi:hypothetical protein